LRRLAKRQIFAQQAFSESVAAQTETTQTATAAQKAAPVPVIYQICLPYSPAGQGLPVEHRGQRCVSNQLAQEDTSRLHQSNRLLRWQQMVHFEQCSGVQIINGLFDRFCFCLRQDFCLMQDLNHCGLCGRVYSISW
jgi:hypothetical protein